MIDSLVTLTTLPADALKAIGTVAVGGLLAGGTYVLSRIKEARRPVEAAPYLPRIGLDPADRDLGFTLVRTGTDLTLALHEHGEILRRMLRDDDDGGGGVPPSRPEGAPVRRPRLAPHPKRIARHSRVVWLSGAGFVFSALQAGMACLASDPPFGPIPFAVATTAVSLAALVLPFFANSALSGDQS